MNLTLFDEPENCDPQPDPGNQEAIQQVYVYWKTVMNYPSRRLTSARKRFIAGRLHSYTVAQLKQVVDIAALDPWWRGQNLRQQPYDDVVNIFRNDERVDMFLARQGRRDLSASNRPIESEEF